MNTIKALSDRRDELRNRARELETKIKILRENEKEELRKKREREREGVRIDRRRTLREKTEEIIRLRYELVKALQIAGKSNAEIRGIVRVSVGYATQQFLHLEKWTGWKAAMDSLK